MNSWLTSLFSFSVDWLSMDRNCWTSLFSKTVLRWSFKSTTFFLSWHYLPFTYHDGMCKDRKHVALLCKSHDYWTVLTHFILTTTYGQYHMKCMFRDNSHVVTLFVHYRNILYRSIHSILLMDLREIGMERKMLEINWYTKHYS